MTMLKNLTEGIVERNLSKDAPAILKKWEQTGLLEGITDTVSRNNMAVLLENQAKELLRESTTMAGGDVEGFAAVAFPIVRRVFAGLIANDLVSVQPMNLPSGLIFFLDFTKQAPATLADGETRDGLVAGGPEDSIYGGGVVGKGLADGVTLGSADSGGFNYLRQGLTSARGAVKIETAQMTTSSLDLSLLDAAGEKELDYDADLLTVGSGHATVIYISGSTLDAAPGFPVGVHPINSEDYAWKRAMLSGLTHLNVTMTGSQELPDNNKVVRRLTKMVDTTGDGSIDSLRVVVQSDTAALAPQDVAVEFAKADAIAEVSEGLGALVGTNTWEMEGSAAIPEINIKVNSMPVTSTTRKLKANWTPELAQDLNAYHNLDAEVELTSILSEEIALEIDQEILGDLLNGATAAKYYWSRKPGNFLNPATGATVSGADFTGTVSEWYETLLETINDASAQIHRKTLRGGANFLVCSPEVANVLEFTSGFRARVTHDVDKGQAGTVNVGSMNNKFEIYVNPYFPRNVILLGRKGSSFLESGYVYSPYVPLQTTPTIFDPDDFTPRKAVMTRYGKKMVRPDMYGLVVVQDLL